MKGKEKAIAAIITPIVAFVVTHYGLNVDPETQAAAVTLLTGAAVYLVPNREP